MIAPTYVEKAVFLLERHGYDACFKRDGVSGREKGKIDIMEQPDLEALLNNNHMLTCAVFRRSFWEQAGGYRDVIRPSRVTYMRIGPFGSGLLPWVHGFGLCIKTPCCATGCIRPISAGNGNTLPVSRQRQKVWQMNQDVLRAVADKIAISRRRAGIQYGTPCAHRLLSFLLTSAGYKSADVTFIYAFSSPQEAPNDYLAPLWHI